VEPLYLELGAPDVGGDLHHPRLLRQVVDVVHVLVAQVPEVLKGNWVCFVTVDFKTPVAQNAACLREKVLISKLPFITNKCHNINV
jgi:hypothetical protein